MPGELTASSEGFALLEKWVNRCGLAACCVALPIGLALVMFNWALYQLTPDIVAKIHVTYVPAQPKPEKAAKQPPADAAAASTSEAAKSTAAPPEKSVEAKKPAKPAKAPELGEPQAAPQLAETAGTTQQGDICKDPAAVAASAAATPKQPADTKETGVLPTQAAEPAKSQAAPESTSGSSEVVADATLFLRGLSYHGEAQYAAASAFIYLASTAVLLFSLTIVYLRWNLLACIASLIFFGGIADYLAFDFHKPRGRELVVENLLNRAEYFPTMRLDKVPPCTGNIVSDLVSYNTIAALVPVGVLLVALALLAVRDPNPERADLTLRRTCLRIALGLGSALFVIGVLANKELVQWPLSLVSESQQLALQPIADSVTLQLGAMGTIAIVAAFAPALTAWWLDVLVFEANEAKAAKAANEAKEAKLKARTGDGKEPNRGGGFLGYLCSLFCFWRAKPSALPTPPADADLSAKKSASEFAFAPLSMISGIIAALAPLLASPFVDALKSVLAAVGGK